MLGIICIDLSLIIFHAAMVKSQLCSKMMTYKTQDVRFLRQCCHFPIDVCGIVIDDC